MIAIILSMLLSAPITTQSACYDLPEQERVQCVREVSKGRPYHLAEVDSVGNAIGQAKKLPSQEESLQSIASSVRGLLILQALAVTFGVIMVFVLQ